MFKVHYIAISVSDIKKSVDFYSFFGSNCKKCVADLIRR